MASAASPTPLGSSNYDSYNRRPATRQFARNPPLRPNLKRRSPLSVATTLNGKASTASGAHSPLDSSDDEGPPPALSAAAEELLGGRTGEKPAANGRTGFGGVEAQRRTVGFVAVSPVSRLNNQASDLLGRSGSPGSFRSGSPRVVRLPRHSPANSGSLRRTASTSSLHEGSPLALRPVSDLKTPAPRSKSSLATSASTSNGATSSGKRIASGSLMASGGVPSGQRLPSAGVQGEGAQDQIPVGSLTGNRTRYEDGGAHNSLRIKRVGKGRFMGGPARRGMVRRQSEEDQSPIRPRGSDAEDHLIPADKENEFDQLIEAPVDRGLTGRDSDHRRSRSFASVAKCSSQDAESPKRSPDAMPLRQKPAAASPGVRRSSVDKPSGGIRPSSTASSKPVPQFKVPPPPILPSLHDQENEPPPTFKRNKAGIEILGSRKDPMAAQMLGIQTPGTATPSRKALAPRSQNTPLRPAPPPPKMSVLETATAAAGGAASSQRRLKRNLITVNGKLFTRMECIGRGGSGRVYRVMAENFKLFALKRVSLEGMDQTAIRGFKGEIDLLQKLKDVDRVVRIYDFEMNEEKKILSVLMDIGELDLKKMLDPRLHEDTGKFDITFTRYIWKEMLECVQAIHDHEIVHSDLKPANFVVIQGRLKLIDFGIANSIQDDTVNVHREQQIGTPNYMAPEALVDINGLEGRKSHLGKLMKLGKPSDVWSLGVILYQIVYGRPPFGHIPNSMNKAMAITDPSYAIAFPEHGVGKVLVPTGLIRTMKGCLNRDPAQRPRIPELLGERDIFLHPDAPGSVPINTEHFKKLQHNVLRIIEAHGMPAAANGVPKEEAVNNWLNQWGPQLFASMKNSVEKGTA